MEWAIEVMQRDNQLVDYGVTAVLSLYMANSVPRDLAGFHMYATGHSKLYVIQGTETS